MKCIFRKLIFEDTDTGFQIAIYYPREKVKDPGRKGRFLDEITAKGYSLPLNNRVVTDLHGSFEKGKYGYTLNVEYYDEVVEHTREGIVGFLSSGLIKGIGPKVAELIYEEFGNKALDIMDKDIGQLERIKGISLNRLEVIKDEYAQHRSSRDLIALLAPHDISPRLAVKISEEYGSQALNTVRSNPYSLCGMHGIGFKTADGIAQSMGIDLSSDERIKAGIVYTLQEAEGSGHLCMPAKPLVEVAQAYLNEGDTVIPKASILACTKLLIKEKVLVQYNKGVFLKAAANAEEQISSRIQYFRKFNSFSYTDINMEILEAEKTLGLKLDDTQRQAVKLGLTEPISIITGGPGTGKTMIENVILHLFKKLQPNGKAILCAPTGMAARRMEEATGHPASTIHRVLNLYGDDDRYEPDELDASMVVADEASMIDIYLARKLLGSIPFDCQLVLIGDEDQLPSVGPGAVFSELLRCGHVPVSRLRKVYRQDSGSLIATNAAKIREGENNLDYGDDFIFIESESPEKSAPVMVELFEKLANEHGIDNVMMLSPMRKNTSTSVNALNEALQERLNPSEMGKGEIAYGKRIYKVGDKVMQLKNKHDSDLSNGDIGRITRIYRSSSGNMVDVQYSGDRTHSYEQGQLKELDLAYATTIHKSQGSQSKIVILNQQTAHYIMLKRPMIYTAITRAIDTVYIVGQKEAVDISIGRPETERRGTMLANRIIESLSPKAVNQ